MSDIFYKSSTWDHICVVMQERCVWNNAFLLGRGSTNLFYPTIHNAHNVRERDSKADNESEMYTLI